MATGHGPFSSACGTRAGVGSGLRCRPCVRVCHPCEDFCPSKMAGVARLLNLQGFEMRKVNARDSAVLMPYRLHAEQVPHNRQARR